MNFCSPSLGSRMHKIPQTDDIKPHKAILSANKYFFMITQSFKNNILDNKSYLQVRRAYTRDVIHLSNASSAGSTMLYMQWELSPPPGLRLHVHYIVDSSAIDNVCKWQRLKSWGNQCIKITQQCIDATGWVNYMDKVDDPVKKAWHIWKPLFMLSTTQEPKLETSEGVGVPESRMDPRVDHSS